jgi:hypothetical protein
MRPVAFSSRKSHLQSPSKSLRVFRKFPKKSLGWKAPAELFLPKGAFDFQKFWSVKINHVAPGL